MAAPSPRKSKEDGPLWWLRWVPAAVLTLLVLWLIYKAGSVALIPLLASFALAYLLEPPVHTLVLQGVRRSIASVTVLALVFVLMAAFAAFVIPNLWNEGVKASEKASRYFTPENAQRTRYAIRQSSPFVDRVFGPRIELLIKDPATATGISSTWLTGNLSGFFSRATEWLDFLVIPFFVYYILVGSKQWRASAEDLIPPRFRPPLTRLFDEVGRILQSYVRGQLLIALIMSGLYALGFLALQVPAWAGLAAISGLLNVIPYVGTLAGMLLAGAFKFSENGDIWPVIGVLAVFAIVQAIEGYYLTPRILGGRLNLHPMAVFLGLLIGGKLFGLLGVLLAIPTVAIAKVFLMFAREWYRGSWFYHEGEDSTMALSEDPAEKLAQVAEVVLAEQQQKEPEEAPLAGTAPNPT